MSPGKSRHAFTSYIAREIGIGTLALGGTQPVRIQSMTNTDTNDVVSSISQCEALIRHGCELVRLTTQGKAELESIGAVREALHKKGLTIPVVADIHFKPGLALLAAARVDKIRINPGNYIDRKGDDESIGKKAQTQLNSLVEICKTHQTAIRIGVNHGSLSERILRKYGDTPEGMVASAMEFVRICASLDFHALVISLKSSNARVMVQSVRLLVATMMKESLHYPIHLGVTEAGDGLYARLKSAAGMAPLLSEGIGDTIRVSLTEDPVNEMATARHIRALFPKPGFLPYHPFHDLAWDPFRFSRRISHPVLGIGGGKPVAIISSFDGIDPDEVAASDQVTLFEHTSESVPEIKYRISEYCKKDPYSPLIYKRILHEANADVFRIKLAGELGSVLIDGAIDGVWVENSHMSESDVYELLLMILQATGSRISQTEYIACPSCGRTHFNIESRLSEIKARTSHLRHLKIGVMGCIVNGPGEMADADYGYVGSGRGKVSIYKGHTPVFKHVPEKDALGRLIALIKESGDWIDP